MMNRDVFFYPPRYPLTAILTLLLSISVHCACLWAADPPIESILPQDGFLRGWAIEGQVKRYTPDNLYTYINGEAEMYMPFGFQIVSTALYVNAGNPDAALVADVYRMGSLIDAFGIYSYYRDPAAAKVQVGSEGFADESQLMFYKDKYFVRLSTSGASSPENAVFVKCAEAIATRIPGESLRPKELEILKVPGITTGTEKYSALSVMGYAFFKRGLTAETDRDRHPLKVFVIIDESEQASSKSFDSYVRYLRERGIKPDTENGAEGLTLRSQDPLYKNVIVRQAGRYLLGVAGTATPEETASLIKSMETRIARP